MSGPMIDRVERTWVSLPLKRRHERHLTRENWDWTVFEVIALHADGGLVGYGETMVYYTWGRVPIHQVERVVGHSPFEFLEDDSLGAGLQMAIYDLAGKALGVPCARLFGPALREWCPISWWANDMSTEDWEGEIREALALGYLSAKLKARPWRDFAAQMDVLAALAPVSFRFDADFNGFLLDAGRAVPYLKRLERNPSLDIFESPIPQDDAAGNALLRRKVERPIALHFGTPHPPVALDQQVCDGYVLGGGVARVRRQAAVCAQMNKPFWLQMVGTGLTTALMLQIGSTLSHNTWPAVTCHDIYVDDLIREPTAIRQGMARVPNGPGLGVDPDLDAIARYRVEEGHAPPPPRNLYRVSWPSGATVTYPVGKQGTPTPYRLGRVGLWDDFAAGNQPLFHAGVRLDIISDDGSAEWSDLHGHALEGPIRAG